MADDIINNYEHYLKLRNMYDTFIYHGYSLNIENNTLKINYSFEIKGLAGFSPYWVFKIPKAYDIYTEAFHNAVFYLGMVELVSYYKITCAKNIIIKGRALDEYEIAWWKKLYFNGLSEFYYRNNILQLDSGLTMENMATFICDNISESRHCKPNIKANLNGCLIPIGGGKDSAVSLELLRNTGLDNYAYIINPRGATIDTAKIYGFDDNNTFTVKRFLDKEMLRLNSEGFLNGHTPFSAIVAFSSIIAAMLCNKKYIVLSNEDSANESTVIGSEVNHQYSKSYEFEQDFVSYEKKYIDSGCYYFSLLRPLCELQIAKIFSKKCQSYFKVFKSCNVGSKENIWCTHCSKCLFVYLIMAPFIKRDLLIKIFGNDLSDDASLIKDFDRLIGLEKEKPFECVGSVDEINTAIQMKIDEYRLNNIGLPLLYRHYVEKGLDKTSYNKEHFLKHFNESNNVPNDFIKIIKECI